MAKHHSENQSSSTGDLSDSIETGGNASPPIPKSGYDLRILQSLRRIIRAVDLHSRQLAMQYDITGPQLACLLVVNEQGPLTTSSLAHQVYLSPSTIVGILDRLEQKGLALRKRNSLDRRVVNIEVTQKGRKLVRSAPSPLQESLASSLQNLPESEQVAITRALEKIIALMEADNIDAAPILATGPLLKQKPYQASRT